MTTDQVNYLNIGLMILSGIVAVFLPFELFLFSYVVLGPLHYLTEISWLHRRQYFTSGRRDVFLLVALFLLILLPDVYRLWFGHSVTATPYYHTLRLVGQVAMFAAFAVAVALVLMRGAKIRFLIFVLIAIIGVLLRSHQFVLLLFTLFLPTLIHVFVFTGAFIIAGAVKSKSFSGVLSAFVFAGCAAALFFISPAGGYVPGNNSLNAYNAGFFRLNKEIFAIFLHRNVSYSTVYTGTGVLIMRFIAFAYTYHYLNWFSKTSVIKWNLIPRRSLALLILLWIMAEVLYFTNYLTGLSVLYFLSLLHVILEFPLNIRSFSDIGKAVKNAVSKW